MTRLIRSLKSVIHRMNGAAGPAVDDAREVFRTFAEGVEARLGPQPGGRPSVRLVTGEERPAGRPFR